MKIPTLCDPSTTGHPFYKPWVNCICKVLEYSAHNFLNGQAIRWICSLNASHFTAIDFQLEYKSGLVSFSQILGQCASFTQQKLGPVTIIEYADKRSDKF